jgi:signal transduction histidine kinase
MRFMVTLESSKLFSHLPADDLQRLKRDVREVAYAAGQEIFKEGDPGDGVYVVKSGSVQISAGLANGDRIGFSHVPPGDVFGEMTLLDQHPRSACATAGLATELYFVPREPLVALLRQTPDLSMTLVQEISKRLREFNQQYVDKVLQAERMTLVGRFASSIIHDLKNPLTIIGIAAQTAGRESATPEARKTAEQRITKQVERITSLVNDILEFTRGGSSTPAFCAVDYAEFLTNLIHDCRPELASKRVAIELESQPPSRPLQLNPKRLTRVFFNLFQNAVDAMPAGGRIRLRFQEREGELVTEIEDEGPGVPGEVLPRIFDAFATFGKPKGTGLGLAIAQRIVEEHGGRIWARNAPAGGALFAFTLPLAGGTKAPKDLT